MNIVHDVSLIDVFALKRSRLGDFLQNSELLFGVELMEALVGHAVDVEVVANLGVSVDTLTMGLSDALGKDAWVLGVKQ